MNVLAVTIGGWDITAQYVFRGFIEGLTYGMVALGLVLIYKASGVVNFAQSQFGAFGALLMTLVSYKYGVPLGLAVPLALVTGAALGAVTELLVVRRLFSQPRLLLFVATLGVSQLIIFLGFQLPEVGNRGESVLYPEMIRFDKPWNVGPIDIRGDQLSVLVVVPIVCAVLGWLLTRTKFGLNVRAAADNPSAASLAGISVKKVSTQVWVLAGVLSAISAVLFGPLSSEQASAAGNSLGPSLLLKALAAGMVGRMRSFTLALVGGIGIGVVETIIKLNTSSENTGSEYVFVFLLLLLLVLVRGANAKDEGGWALPKLRSASRDLANLPAARWVTRIVIVLLGGAAILRGLTLDQGADFQRYTIVLIYMIVALSSTVLTGWAGQLSLGQFAFVGVGVYATGYYGQTATNIDEHTPAGVSDFASDLCHRWEARAQTCETLGMRYVALRFGLVMGRSGGSLPPLLMSLKLGAGSIIGSGRQFVSWIHIEDALGVIAHAIRDARLEGPINAVAPEAVSYEAFMREAGTITHRPVWLKIPEQLLRKLLGEMSIMLVEGPCVLPGKLRTLHHEFRFRTLRSALTDLV